MLTIPRVQYILLKPNYVTHFGVLLATTFKMVPQTSINPKTTQLEYFFFFSFAYTTSAIDILNML